MIVKFLFIQLPRLPGHPIRAVVGILVPSSLLSNLPKLCRSRCGPTPLGIAL